MSFFIANAFAEGAATAPANPFGPMIMFGGMLLIFYFLMWRPQSKRAKEHKQLLESLAKGDEVQMSGGILGKIIKVEAQYVVLEIADKVEVKVQKSTIAAMLPKGTLKSI
jgi:preprotein translocase subunit YajC